jgi:hypothetical protein
MTSATNPAADTAAFAELVMQWYDPTTSNNAFVPTLDYRRWAPDIYEPDTMPWADYIINRHISQFDEGDLPPIDSGFLTGKSWDIKNIPDVQSSDINSAGLACFVVNYPLEGRAANKRQHFIGIFVGKSTNFFQVDDSNTSQPTVFQVSKTGQMVQLLLQPVVRPNYDRMIAILAHELGHAFALGDEYEEAIPSDPRVPTDEAHRFDNLVAYLDIAADQNAPPVAAVNYEAPLNPLNIPWSVLHRIRFSFTVVETATVADPNSVTLKLSPDDLKRLSGIRGIRLYIRRMIINTHLEGARRQLRTSVTDMQNQDIFTELDMDGDPDVGASTVTLKISSASHPTALPTAGPDNNLIPAGSILYIPVKDPQSGVPLSLIETPVMNFMNTTKYDGSPFTGRALSTNYDGTAGKWKGVNPGKDSPPDIPGWKGPCKGYTMIGIYEGGARFVGSIFRPAGACKMRDEYKTDLEGQYCFVCKYLLVSRINPSKLGDLDKQYPSSKGNKWQNIIGALGGIDTSGIK